MFTCFLDMPQFNLCSAVVMFRLPNLDNRGIHYPIVAGTEQLVTDLISTREWDIRVILLIRSLMEEIYVRGGEDPPIADESREERCGLTAIGVINHRLLAEFRHKSPGTFEGLKVCFDKSLNDLFCAGDRERECRGLGRPDEEYVEAINICDRALFGFELSVRDTDEHEILLGLRDNPKLVPVGGAFRSESRLAMALKILDSPSFAWEATFLPVSVRDDLIDLFVERVGSISGGDASVLYMLSLASAPGVPLETNVPFLCGSCGNVSPLACMVHCGGCRVLGYCSPECLGSHMERHSDGQCDRLRVLHDSGGMPVVDISRLVAKE